LSANWFPSDERTTATAIASLCGSLGVALSFIISPSVVKDIDTTYQKNTTIRRNASVTLEEFLSETVFKDAIHYWPIDNMIEEKDSPKIFHDYKNLKHGYGTGDISIRKGVTNHGVATKYKQSSIITDKLNEICFSNPSQCQKGLSVAFWVKLGMSLENRRFLLGTSTSTSLGTSLDKKSKIGIWITQIQINKNIYLTIKIGTRQRLWTLKPLVLPDKWIHVSVTWNTTNGLSVYLNGKLNSRSNYYRSNFHQNVVVKRTLIISKPVKNVSLNKSKLLGEISFDDIALWDRILNQDEIAAMHYSTSHKGRSIKEKEYELDLQKEIEERKLDIMNLLYVEFGVNSILFILVLVYFPDKPPLPPSLSAHQQRDDFKEGAKRLLRNRNFWTLCLIYGITTGVYSGWGAVLNVNLSYFGISQKEAGWLGFYTMLAGITAGMILARCADLFSGRMKALLILLFTGATGCFLWFCLLCLKIIPFSEDSLYKSAILGGFFVSGTIPLFYELTIEQTYPVPEGITTGILTMVNNAVTVLFLVALLIPKVGTIWMNWVLFGSCAISLPILLVFKESYNRLDIDIGLEEKNESLLHTPIETPLYQTVAKVTENCKQTAILHDENGNEVTSCLTIDRKKVASRIAGNGSLWSLTHQQLSGFLEKVKSSSEKKSPSTEL